MADAEKIVLGFVVLVVIAAIVLTAVTLKPFLLSKEEQPNYIEQMHSSKMAFTSFDIELAKKFMDKDNDGKCDSCGMRIEDCIASGMMQCSMDPEAKMGALGSAHIHADLKVYLNGKAMDFAKQEYYMKSMMMHLDDHPNPDDAGSVLHMHAKGVPLWIFFESIELELPSRTEAYVNGEKVLDYTNYVFNGLDKILITDGKGDLQQQLASVTEFSKNH